MNEKVKVEHLTKKESFYVLLDRPDVGKRRFLIC